MLLGELKKRGFQLDPDTQVEGLTRLSHAGGYTIYIYRNRTCLLKPNGKAKIYVCSPASFLVALDYSMKFFGHGVTTHDAE